MQWKKRIEGKRERDGGGRGNSEIARIVAVGDYFKEDKLFFLFLFGEDCAAYQVFNCDYGE